MIAAPSSTSSPTSCTLSPVQRPRGRRSPALRASHSSSVSATAANSTRRSSSSARSAANSASSAVQSPLVQPVSTPSQQAVGLVLRSPRRPTRDSSTQYSPPTSSPSRLAVAAPPSVPHTSPHAAGGPQRQHHGRHGVQQGSQSQNHPQSQDQPQQSQPLEQQRQESQLQLRQQQEQEQNSVHQTQPRQGQHTRQGQDQQQQQRQPDRQQPTLALQEPREPQVRPASRDVPVTARRPHSSISTPSSGEDATDTASGRAAAAAAAAASSSSAAAVAAAEAATPASPPKRPRRRNPDAVVMPRVYANCDAKELAVVISDMLLELIRVNDEIPLQDGQLTRFHSRAPPGISVRDYLHRLTYHATLPPPILLAMVTYVDKLCAMFPAFRINSLTVHRFLITAATVASKGLSDSFWTNSTYSKVGGVTIKELALLELELLERVEWRIVPRPEVLDEYYQSLVERSDRHVLEGEEGASGPSESTAR